MKKVFLFLLVTSIGYGQTLTDTVRFAKPYASVTYTAGDIVRADSTTGGSFLAFRVVSNTASSQAAKGYITQVQLFHDTANVTNGNFTVLFFSDTTNLFQQNGYQLPADNAAYQSNFAVSKYRVGSVSLSFSMYGTTGGGATMAGGGVENLNIPFFTKTGKLFAVIVCDGAYLAKRAGLFRLHVSVERTF